MDHFEERVKVSWFKRFKNALISIIFAPLFAAVGFFLLRQGEIDHANSTNALKQVNQEVLSEQDAQNGHLFFMTDSMRSSGILKDKEFGLEVKAVKLYRKAYSWQWLEIVKEREERTLTGGKEKIKTYDYVQGWSGDLIRSDRFKYPEGHENPHSMSYTSQLIEQDKIHVGKYELDDRFKASLATFTVLDINPGMFKKAHNAKFTTDTSITINEEVIVHLTKAGLSNSKVTTPFMFIGKGEPNKPQLGDTKIVYWHINDGLYTVVGQKQDNKITTIEKADLFIHSELPDGFLHSHSGFFGMLFHGEYSLKEMFKTVHDKNDLSFIIMRFAGLLFTVAGFLIFANPLQILFGWLPFIGVVWEKLVFKLMQVLGTFTALCISGYYWFVHNSFSNLTIYDLYFVLVVIVFLVFCNSMKASVTSGNKEIYSGSF